MIKENKNNNLVTLYKNQDAFDFLEKKFGQEYIEYRRNWTLASEKKEHFRVPIHLDLDVNNVCNMSCINCNAVTSKSGDRYAVDVDILMKRLEESIPSGVRAVNFGNCSEPLLSEVKLFDLINFVRNSGIIDIFIHTNGYLLDKSMSEKVINSGVTKLCISIDAADEATFSTIGRSGYKKVINNIQQFLQVRSEMKSILPLLRVSFCPNQHNFSEIEKFREFWKDSADIVEVQSLYDMRREGEIQKVLIRRVNGDCTDPWRRLIIWPNNSYGACCQHFAFKRDNALNLGSIYENSIEEIWNSEKMNSLRTSITLKSFYKDCLDCISNRYTVESL